MHTHQTTYLVAHSSNVNLDLDPLVIYEDRRPQLVEDIKKIDVRQEQKDKYRSSIAQIARERANNLSKRKFDCLCLENL